MAQHERIAVIVRYETEEDMLEDLKVSLERKGILFVEKYNEEDRCKS